MKEICMHCPVRDIIAMRLQLAEIAEKARLRDRAELDAEDPANNPDLLTDQHTTTRELGEIASTRQALTEADNLLDAACEGLGSAALQGTAGCPHQQLLQAF